MTSTNTPDGEIDVLITTNVTVSDRISTIRITHNEGCASEHGIMQSF